MLLRSGRCLQRPLFRGIRDFSMTHNLCGELKTRVRAFRDEETILKRTPKDYQRKSERIRKKILETKEKSYTNQQAGHIASKLLGRPIDLLSNRTPLSNAELVKLFEHGDRRLLYSVLGTSGLQVQDSYLVQEDTRKLLKFGDVERAVLLCRLAKQEGIVGMNDILIHLFKSGRHEDAESLFYNRGKWGVENNSISFTILFDGYAKRNRRPTPKECSKLFDLYTKLAVQEKEGRTATTIHLNSCLSALIRCTDLSYAWKIFEFLPKTSQPNTRTYTILLSGLKYLEDEDCVPKLELVWKIILEELAAGSRKLSIDSGIISTFTNAYTSRQDPVLIHRGIEILYQFFEFPFSQEQFPLSRPQETNKYEFIPVNEINPTGEKRPANAVILDILLNGYRKLGNHDQVYQIVLLTLKEKSQWIDDGSLKLGLRSVFEMEDSTPTDKILKLFNIGNEKLKKGKVGNDSKSAYETILCVLKAFRLEANREEIVTPEFSKKNFSKMDTFISSLKLKYSLPLPLLLSYLKIVESLRLSSKETELALNVWLKSNANGACNLMIGGPLGINSIQSMVATEIPGPKSARSIRKLSYQGQGLVTLRIKEVQQIGLSFINRITKRSSNASVTKEYLDLLKDLEQKATKHLEFIEKTLPRMKEDDRLLFERETFESQYLEQLTLLKSEGRLSDVEASNYRRLNNKFNPKNGSYDSISHKSGYLELEKARNDSEKKLSAYLDTRL